MSRDDRGADRGRPPGRGRRARPERDESTDPYGQYSQAADGQAHGGRYAGRGPDDSYPQGSGYPAQPGFAPDDGYPAGDGLAPDGSYQDQRGYGGPSYPGHDGYPGRDGYPGQDGYPGHDGYAGQNGYAAQNGYAGDGYGANGHGGHPGPGESYPAQAGYPAQPGYPGPDGYTGQGSYPGPGEYQYGGDPSGHAQQNGAGPAGAADYQAGQYPAADGYAGQGGGYPSGPHYRADDSQPGGPALAPDGSYPPGEHYPSGPGFAPDGSYPGDQSYPSGPGGAPDDTYLTGHGFTPQDSYPSGPVFPPGDGYDQAHGGDPEASGPYRWRPPAALEGNNFDGSGDDPRYQPGAGQYAGGYQEPGGPHGYPSAEPDSYHDEPDGYHDEPDGYLGEPGYRGGPDGYHGEPGYHGGSDGYDDGSYPGGPGQPPPGRGAPEPDDAPHGFVPGLARGSAAGSGGPPRRRRPMRRIAPLIAVVVVLGLLVTGGIYALKVYRGRHANFAGSGSGTVIFQVKPGDGPDELAPELVSDGVIAAAAPFIAAASASNTTSGLQPGYFRLQKHMSAAAAYQALINPKLAVQANVTLPEGLRAINVVRTLGAHSKIPGTSFSISESQYAQALKDTKALGLPSYANGNPEGYLFPATYPVTPGSTATSVLQAMVARFKEEAASVNLPAWAKRDHFTQAQIITEASLIQAEGGQVKDFGKIARVIDNRLVQGINLQLDSTVFYALNKYGIAASSDDLKVKSPYNTYTHPDLPPGPIDSPGDAAIKAALHPEQGDWLYFVTVNPGTGETKFTDSESQFEVYQAELHNYLASHGGG